jgi:hypothetical protein
MRALALAILLGSGASADAEPRRPLGQADLSPGARVAAETTALHDGGFLLQLAGETTPFSFLQLHARLPTWGVDSPHLGNLTAGARLRREVFAGAAGETVVAAGVTVNLPTADQAGPAAAEVARDPFRFADGTGYGFETHFRYAWGRLFYQLQLAIRSGPRWFGDESYGRTFTFVQGSVAAGVRLGAIEILAEAARSSQGGGAELGVRGRRGRLAVTGRAFVVRGVAGLGLDVMLEL